MRARRSNGERAGQQEKQTPNAQHPIKTLVDLDNTSQYLNGLANVLVMETDLAQLANDRFEIADALHRYAFGLDHGDADSLASALTEDCRFDFRPAGRKLEIDFPLLSGRDAILNAVLPLIGPLDTSHSVSNVQIEIVGDTATLYAYVLSQHFMPRQGSRRGSEYALLMNRYDCNLMRDRDKWRFNRMTIDNAWALGNPEILNALGQPARAQNKIEKDWVEGTRRPTQTLCKSSVSQSGDFANAQFRRCRNDADAAMLRPARSSLCARAILPRDSGWPA